MLPRRRRLADLQHAVGNRQRRVGRDHIDMIGLHPLAIRTLADVHCSAATNQFREQAGVLRRKVLDQDERHPAIRRHRCEKALERFQAPGRCTDPDDQEWSFLLNWRCAWLRRALGQRVA